jgi:hypothetical protein
MYFIMGFSSNINTIPIRVNTPDGVGNNTYTVYLTDLQYFTKQDWVELTLIIIDYSNDQCSGGSIEYKQLIQSTPGSNMSRDITSYRDNLFYLAGLSSLDLDGGNFNYNEDMHDLETQGRSYFRYSVIGLNLTCTLNSNGTNGSAVTQSVSQPKVSIVVPSVAKNSSQSPQGHTNSITKNSNWQHMLSSSHIILITWIILVQLISEK